MLTWRRKQGQTVQLRHRQSGDVVTVRLDNVAVHKGQGRAELVFNDPRRNFDIVREETSTSPEIERLEER